MLPQNHDYMKANVTGFCIILLVALSKVSSFAQVEAVKYQIKYNELTCLFDCCLIIHEGSAVSAIQRAQFSAQYSVIVPAGSAIENVSNKNPIQGNISYKGTKPTIWYLASHVENPESLTGSDIYAFTPTLSPTSFYNNLNKGDTLVLFSLKISPIVSCASGVRLFENGIDPASNAPGMEGGDYSQGFTMGSTDQKYFGNGNALYPKSPKITTLYTSCNSGVEIFLDATTSGCQAPLRYSWNGPDGFTSDIKDVLISNSNPFNSGSYSVKVSDYYGCSVTRSVNAISKPDGGPDQEIKCYATGAATLSAKGNGKWTIDSASAGTATIQNQNQNQTTLYNFSNPGVYYLLWSDGLCQDTVVVRTGMNCNCAITPNVLFTPNQYDFCGMSSKDTLTGSNITEVEGTYKWIYKLNNQSYTAAPGTNNTKDYIVSNLNVGLHRYQRIFQKTSQPACVDTSNMIEINILPYPDAGKNDTLFCAVTDTAFLVSSTDGFWSLGQGSAGGANFSSVSGRSVKAFGFTSSGNYNFVRSNGICSDTTIITVQDYCGCDYAYAGDSLTMCTGDSYSLIGNCVLGIWSSVAGNPEGALIDATINGNSNVHFSKMAAGDYKFVYIVLGKYRDTLTIDIKERPIVNIGEDFGYCNDGSSFIVAASGGITYLWSTGATANAITVNPDTTTEYVVTGFNQFGCAAKDTINIIIYDKPIGSIPPIQPVFVADPLMLMAGEWKYALEYRWVGPNDFTSSSPVVIIPNATKQNAGMYFLSVMSPDECYTYSSVMVQVMERLLPVRLIDFNGHYDIEVKANLLEWSTFSEANSDYFIIERSTNGTDFNEISRVKSAGNSTSIQKYNLADDRITKGARYYYKLLQVDLDGKISNEGIVSIYSISENNMHANLYPNPVNTTLNLNLSGKTDGDLTLTVINSTGKSVWSKVISDHAGSDNLMADFEPNQFNDGIYFIHISSATFSEILRFVIIR